MIDEPQTTESLMRLQKTQICNSLLHRIRLIQGRTNLNFNEPHFIESKDNIRQTKDIIQSIKEGLKKGCSELIHSCEQSNRFHSETNSSLTEKLNKKNKLKRQVQKSNSDKIESKQSKNKRGTTQEIVDFYEGTEKQAEVSSDIKLSQIFLNNEEQQELQPVSSTNINNKGNKKKKRKRKQDENDSNSSLTQSRSKCDLKKASQQGDAVSLKTKSRKTKFRRNRKRIECSGDESDVEEDVCSYKIGEEHIDSNLQNEDKPRRKLRNKQRPKTPTLASMRRQDRPQITDFKEMVSTTIARLNTVNESVQKVIEDSLSSSSSLTKKYSFADVQPPYIEPQNLKPKDPSATSISWSTVTITNANDNSEASIVTQKPSSAEKSQPSKKVAPPKKSPDKNKPPENPQSTITVASSCLEQASTKKKGRAQPVENRIKKDIEKTLSIEKEVVQKKKKGAKKKEEFIEPVSSMKKVGKKKKTKNVVNFNTVPEVVPNYTSEPSSVVLPTKPTKSVRAVLNQAAVPQGRPQIVTKLSKDESGRNTPIKSKHDNRRVSSARSHRNVHKKIVCRVKSTGNISPEQSKVPLSVRTVLQEEAKNLEELKLQRSRSRSPNRSEFRTSSSSRSGSQKRGDDTRSKVMEIYHKVRSNTTDCIANVNEQMSFTLKESIAHLNEICGKVRTTLTDMEKDEENYKKLKSNKSFEVSSEGGSVHDGSISSMQTSKRHLPSPREKPEAKVEEVSAGGGNQTYTVITESIPDTRIGELIQNLSMAGDNVVVEHPSPQSKQKKKRPISSKSKRRRSATTKPTKSPSASSSKAKIEAIVKSTSAVKSNAVKIPIWQRTPPSVIEEIQLTVKKQATKSQYREFLRALKSIAKKERSQVHVMPCEYKDAMEKQQDTAFNETFKHKPVKRKKESKIVEETQFKKSCQNCMKDKCTCGVVVENTSSPLNQQRMHWMHVRSDSKRGIQAYDILDEITLKDLEPIQSEYPRKDHINDTDANKRIEETLLYKLLYHEDPKVLESLLRSTPVSDSKTVSQISNSISAEKQKSASNAYKLYEQLEFNTDKPYSLSTTKASMCIATPEPQKFAVIDKPKPIHTCPREFNDEVNIPADLKPTLKTKYIKRKSLHVKSKDDDISIRSRKRIEDKLKIIGKTSSIKSIGKRIRNGKISKENIKAKLKGYNVETDLRMKKMLTVMPVTIVPKSKRPLSKTDKDEQNTTKKNVVEMQVTPENLEKIQKMSKREIVQILKPYIFYDLQPRVIVAMPVIPKYNHQNKQKQPESPISNRSTTYKRVSGYLKDHDDDCRSGRKLCRRCQMAMQWGDETKANNVTSRRSEPLNQRQLWKTKYKPTPAENLVTKVLGKNHGRRKFEAIPPNERSSNKDMVINVSHMELNKTATTTRNKLKEVKDIMETHKTLLGQNLDDIIDTLEFKIVDALANPNNQHTDAFNEIEFEIKSILNTINELKEINKENIQKSTNKFKSKTSTTIADSSDQILSIDSSKNITDVNLLQTRNKSSTDEFCKDDIEKNPPIRVQTPEAVKRISVADVSKEKELDDTYCCLGKDIRKVIEGLDAIMSLDEDVDKVINITELQVVTDTQIPQEKSTTPPADVKEEKAEAVFAPSECEQAITSFCEQVDEVMKSISNIEDFNASTDNLETDVEEKKSDEYLTPFMRAVKDYRNSDAAQNFIDFLDKLTMISNDTVSLHIYPNIPFHRATLQQNYQVFEVAETYNQAIQHNGLSSDKAVGVTIVENTLVEQESDKSNDVKNSNDKSIGVDDTPLTAKDFIEDISEEHIGENNKDYILCTNQWMQTDEGGSVVSMQNVKNEVVQTIEAQMQFNEIEEYKLDINCASEQMKRIKTTILISDKKTQAPSEDGHCCFVETCTRDVQVTQELAGMTCITVGNQVDYTTVEVISAECQVISATSNDVTYDESMDRGLSFKQISSVDALEMEKYATSRLENCLTVDSSDLSIDEYPRNIYTETFVSRDRYEQITEALMCEKRNSYPITKMRQNQSDIISLFENHKSISRDFLEEGFGNAADDSYDSMLARYASSENAISSSPSVETTVERIITPIPNPITSVKIKELNPPLDKLIIDEEDYDKRHKHLLHSVYGLVFTLMFLGINLNYSCCN